MSRLTSLLAFLALSVYIFASEEEARHKNGLCKEEFCKCTAAKHPSKIAVNCTVPKEKNLMLYEGDIPENTDSLTVSGAKIIMIDGNTLSKLKDVRFIHLISNENFVMKSYAAVNLNIVNLYMKVERSKTVNIQERAFNKIKGPLSVSIHDCNTVYLGGESFSWLLAIEIINVTSLNLGTSAFMLDSTAANVGEHGPGMSIRMKNITNTSFPDQAFGSSAAIISLEQVVVGTVHTGAFSANTYNIVMAVNCSFFRMEGNSFAPQSLIHNLYLTGCKIVNLSTKAVLSAVANMKISHTRFENIETGAINATVVAVIIIDSVFRIFNERGFELSSWNKLQLERNSFDELAPNAIIAPGGSIHELVFVDNEIENINPGSIGFIGKAYSTNADNVIYKNNYFGQPCHCNITSWLARGLNAHSGEPFENESYCTVDEFFARCFNVPEQNMLFKKFHENVCNENLNIQCERYKSKGLGANTEIKNPRFPHKKEEDEMISDRNKKVIGIVIVTALGCVIIIMFISFIRWMRRRGYCVNIKNFIISSNSSCGTICDRLCICRVNNGMDNARSISQLSVNEYSERHRLNEPRIHEVTQDTAIPNTYIEDIATENKTTQTLPEELTKELLENLKEKLEDPENYVEAREMIEHLYELIKVEENCNNNSPTLLNVEENIYELPFQSTTPRVGKNKKQMISVGTRTPSLDKLMPLSPYNRQTALAHEYFEPKDFAVHLYAEIANCDKEKRTFIGAIPDVVAEQAIPRGPYLRAVREKMNSSASASPSNKSQNSSLASPLHVSTIKSNKSTASNNSGKMINRPLPDKPVIDPGEGTSFRHG